MKVPPHSPLAKFVQTRERMQIRRSADQAGVLDIGVVVRLAQ